MLPTCQRCYLRCPGIDERGNICNNIFHAILIDVDFGSILISFFIYLLLIATLPQLDPTAPAVYVNNTSVLLNR